MYTTAIGFCIECIFSWGCKDILLSDDKFPKIWEMPNTLGYHTPCITGSGVNVTSSGRPYLGAAIGSEQFVEEYAKSKVGSWMSNITLLSEIAKSQPQAAFSALTHGLLSKWTYFSRVIPNISHLLEPLENIIRSGLIPALTGRPPPNDFECDLFAPPAARLGGLGIRLPSKKADREHNSSHCNFYVEGQHP